MDVNSCNQGAPADMLLGRLNRRPLYGLRPSVLGGFIQPAESLLARKVEPDETKEM